MGIARTFVLPMHLSDTHLECRVEAAALVQVALLVRHRREQVSAVCVADRRRPEEQNLRVGRAQAAPALVQLLDPVHELALAACLEKDGSVRVRVSHQPRGRQGATK